MVETAEKHVCACADSDCRTCGCAAIMAFQRSLSEIRCGRQHRPDDYRGLQVSYVSAEFRDGACVVFRVSRLQSVGTFDLARGTENESPSGSDVTRQVSGTHGCLRLVRARFYRG